MKKRILSILLCVVMVITIMPTVVFAAVDDIFTANATLNGNPIDCQFKVLTENATTGTVEVGKLAIDYTLSGSLIIPKTVENNGITYTVKKIGSYAFSNRELTDVSIPEGVTTIGSRAFEYCTSLKTVTIPSTVETIENGAFYGCTALTNINIPKGVSIIGDGAFYNCTALANINIPEEVTTIGSYAFENCTSLESVIIPSNVTSIGYDAFKGCNKLTSATFLGTTAPTIGSAVFKNTASTFAITVPQNGMGYADSGRGWTEEYTEKIAGQSIATVTSVTVEPAATSIDKGRTEQFSVTVDGKNNPAQTVTWSVTDKTSSATEISATGLLTVGADESAKTLTITATSTVDTGKKGTATVTVTTSVPTIRLDANGIPAYSNTDGYNYIYFGSYNSDTVKWRVLDNKTNTGENGLFLLSDTLFGTGQNGNICFDNTRNPNSSAWQGSVAQSWCSDFAASGFDPKETSAILTTKKDDAAFTSSVYNYGFAAVTGILNNDKVFFISAQEAENPTYGFSGDADRIANYNGNAGVWWLRSPRDNSDYSAGMVNNVGVLTSSFVNFPLVEARPAFNLDTSKVLFISAAEGGKSASGINGNLTPVSSVITDAWKLTLKDSTHSEFTASLNASSSATVTDYGGVVSVDYSGATTGSNEYISAMIVNSSGNVLYYGNISNNRASGIAQEVIIPSGLAAGSYTLKIFNEQLNGDKTTDYASDFKNISITITQTVPSTNITDIPTLAILSTQLTLTGTVTPTDATNKTIVWSVKDAGTTGASISGNTFTATSTGTATVTATIINGTALGTDYTKDFTIAVHTVTVNSPSLNIADGSLYLRDDSGYLQYSRDNSTWTDYTGTITLTGTTTTNTVSVQSGRHSLKIHNLSIDTSANDASTTIEILAGEENRLDLILSGTNNLKSGQYRSGICVRGTATLTITSVDGDGSSNGILNVTGGFYGIGRGLLLADYGMAELEPEEDVLNNYTGILINTIKINGGTIIATAGTSGGGVGGINGLVTVSGGTLISTGAVYNNSTKMGSMYKTITVKPVVGYTASGWEGTSESETTQFLTDVLAETNLTGNSSHYIKLVFTQLPKLETPTDLAWDNTTTGKATWGAVAGAVSYSVQLYRDGTALGDSVTVSDGTEYNFVSAFTEAGSYTFTVTAIGNNTDHISSDMSTASAAYTVTKLSVPSERYWNVNSPGIATWTGVANSSGYSVQLYKDGAKVGDALHLTGVRQYDFNSVMESHGSGKYTFTVKTLSNGFPYIDSSESPASNPYTYVAKSIINVDITWGTVDEENRLIFTDKTLLRCLDDVFTVSEGSSLSVAPSLSGTGYSYCGTGTLVTVTTDDGATATYTLIVNGDINGDSVCDSLDAMQAELALNGHLTPADAEQRYYDVDKSGVYDIYDFQLIMNYSVGIR